MPTNASLKAWGLLLLLSLIWGSSFILIKRGLVGLDPIEVGAVRILSASIFLLPFAYRSFKRIERRHLQYLISVGLLGSFIPAFLFAIAQTQLESGITGVLNALTPISTILIGRFLFGQEQKRMVYLGVLIGFIGTAILIMAGSNGDLSQVNYYALFVVLATIMYAVNLNLIKHRLHDLRSMTITSISLVIAGPLAFLTLLFYSDFFSRLMSSASTFHATTFIVLLGVLGTAIALLIFNKLVSLTDPLFTSSVTYIIPLVAIAWGLLDGEILYVSHGIGIVAVLLGVYISNRAKRNKKSQSQ